MQEPATLVEPPVPTRTPRRRFLKIAAWVVAAVVALTAVSIVAVPPLAKRLLTEKLGAALRRPVAVGEIRFNPLQLSLTVTGFTVGEREGRGEFFAFDELFVDLEAISLVDRAPVVRELRLSGSRVRVARLADGGVYNFSDLLAGAAKAPAGGEKTPRAGEPARFAVHNIRISGGRVEFEDRPRAARHEVSEIELTIPFVSNFAAHVDTFEQPALSARVNGAPFSLAGRTKPFKETLETTVDIDLQQVDLPRYLAYLPADLGFIVREGVLGTKLSISFSHLPVGQALLVRGAARLDRAAIADAAGDPLLSFASLEVPAFTLDVFRRRLDVEQVLLRGPEAALVLREKGGLNWSTVFPAPSPDAEPNPWQVTLKEVQLADGKLNWRDEAVPGGFSASFEGLEAALRPYAFPQREPAGIDLKFRTGFGESLTHRGSLVFSPLAWEGDLALSGVRPRAWEAYYRRSFAYEVRDGVIDASARVRLAVGDDPLVLVITGFTGRLEALKLRERGAPADVLGLAALELSGAGLDLRARHLNLGSVAFSKGVLSLLRREDGSIVPGVPEAPGPRPGAGGAQAPDGAPPPASPPASAPPQQAPKPVVGEAAPWLFEAAAVRLDECGVTLVDQTLPDWTTHTIGSLSVEAKDLSTKKGSRARFRLAAALNGEGRLTAKGDVVLAPPAARVDLELKSLSLVPWYPYFADRVTFVTSSGFFGVKGSIDVAATGGGTPRLSFRGEAGVADFVAVDRLNAEEMLKWKSLSFGGVALELSPFKLAVDEAVISEFFSRLVIFPDGRLNVQKAVAAADSGADPEGTPPAAAKPVEPAAPAPTESAAAVPQPPAPVPAAAVTVAKTTIQGGTVSFTDLFVKPNYSAVLTDLAGSVSGLSSQPGTTADLEVRGRLDQSAPLSISGKINPLAGNLFLDVKAAVRDIELGAFSPYSGKYLGYGIDKGKLRFDVAYRVENRQLSGENRLVLDQLAFGEKVASPEATSLPVRLAVSLLKDRHGVIDVNLPIGGSLDDPQFSVGRIVLQVVINIIAKAVTSPFKLIGSLFGGGGELSFAQFETGDAVPVAEGRKGIEALRAALVDRPGLGLEITGYADPAADRASLRRRRFEQQLKAQKLKDVVRKGAAAPSLDAVVVEPKEYEKYLRRVYREAKFPRPRNVLGLIKDLPVSETESLLLTHTVVTDDDLVGLANRRAQAAKDLLTAGEGVEPGRIFLLAPVLGGADVAGSRPAARVEFNLK